MSIKINLPEIAALRGKVEEKLGHQIQTHHQFLQLVESIEDLLGEHMSETTLERIWSYSTRKHDAVSLRTLDVLARYAGYNHWEQFCSYLKAEAGIESELFAIASDSLSVDSLEVGERLRIGWQPNRLCVIRYLGDGRFVAEQTENSSMKPGDSFTCRQFHKHRLLYLDNFLRDGEQPDGESISYAVGKEHGLTLLEKMSEE